MRHVRRNGYALVEVVVCVAIAAVLIGLVLTAVQKARESSHSQSCKNNLRQIGLAWNAHAAAHTIYPTTGAVDFLPITYTASGSPAVAPDQAGSWLFQLLPWLDREPVWRQGGAASRYEACDHAVSAPVATLFCPSRPRARQWQPPTNTLPYTMVYGYIGKVRAGNDYALNNGTGTLLRADESGDRAPALNGMATRRDPKAAGLAAGVLRPADVTDGTSTTLLAADRRVLAGGGAASLFNTQGYADGTADTVCGADRGASPHLPVADQTRVTDDLPGRYGSPHPSGINAAFADGSVRAVSYSLSPDVWLRICVRNDGLPVAGDY